MPTETKTQPENSARIASLETQLATMRLQNLETKIDGLIAENRIAPYERQSCLNRAFADPTFIGELEMRRPIASPGLEVVSEGARGLLAAIKNHVHTGPEAVASASRSARAIAEIFRNDRDRDKILEVFNFSSTTIDSALKRTIVLQESVRDFALRVLPLRMFASTFENVALEGSDTVTVRYYGLQTNASTDYDSSAGYVFTQGNTTNKQQITVNKRKYQPIDYSSQDFRRQPAFDALRLGRINAEKLGYDVLTDVLSIVTAANYGAAIKTIGAGAISSDDIVDLRGTVNGLNWPDGGRSLIVDSTIDNSLQKDNAYKLALNIGTNSVIQQGRFPKLSGFDYAWLPNLPQNGENLIGIVAFQSGILFASAPVAPAPGVRQQLVDFQTVIDPGTEIALTYRHWGLGQTDRDYEVIECSYGYDKGVTAALKRIVHP